MEKNITPVIEVKIEKKTLSNLKEEIMESEIETTGKPINNNINSKPSDNNLDEILKKNPVDLSKKEREWLKAKTMEMKIQLHNLKKTTKEERSFSPIFNNSVQFEPEEINSNKPTLTTVINTTDNLAFLSLSTTFNKQYNSNEFPFEFVERFKRNCNIKMIHLDNSNTIRIFKEKIINNEFTEQTVAQMETTNTFEQTTDAFYELWKKKHTFAEMKILFLADRRKDWTDQIETLELHLKKIEFAAKLFEYKSFDKLDYLFSKILDEDLLTTMMKQKDYDDAIKILKKEEEKQKKERKKKNSFTSPRNNFNSREKQQTQNQFTPTNQTHQTKPIGVPMTTNTKIPITNTTTSTTSATTSSSTAASTPAFPAIKPERK